MTSAAFGNQELVRHREQNRMKLLMASLTDKVTFWNTKTRTSGDWWVLLFLVVGDISSFDIALINIQRQFRRVYFQNYGGYIVSFVFCSRGKNKKKQTTLHFYLCFLLKKKEKNSFVSFILYRQTSGYILKDDGFHIPYHRYYIEYRLIQAWTFRITTVSPEWSI